MNHSEDDALYSAKDKLRVSNIFKVHFNFLKVVGQTNPEFENWMPHSIGKVLNVIFIIFINFLTLHLSLFHAKSTYDHFVAEDLENFSDALTMTVIYSFVTYSTFYFQLRTSKFREFSQFINKNYRHRSIKGLTFVNSYQSYKIAKNLTISWQSACIFCVLCWGALPIVTRKRTLPLKCWYPFDTKGPYVYEFLYFMQLVAQIQVGLVFGNSSALFTSMIMVMCGQFDVLYCSLKNFTHNALLNSGVDIEKMQKIQETIDLDEGEVNQYVYCDEHKVDLNTLMTSHEHMMRLQQYRNTDFKIVLRDSLERCVKTHHFILEACARVEELFSPFCLVKSFQVIFQLCFLGFVTVISDRSTARSINLIQYLIMTILELLLFTYYGELLKGHSLRATEALMRSPWYNHCHLVKKDILIFMENTHKPVNITAGKFFKMDVDRLKTILTSSFSFLTLLRKLAEKPN